MSDPDWVPVKQVMRTEIPFVDGRMTVLEALRVMKRDKVTSLIVNKRFDRDEWGMLLFSDIAKQVIARDRAPERDVALRNRPAPQRLPRHRSLERRQHVEARTGQRFGRPYANGPPATAADGTRTPTSTGRGAPASTRLLQQREQSIWQCGSNRVDQHIIRNIRAVTAPFGLVGILVRLLRCLVLFKVLGRDARRALRQDQPGPKRRLIVTDDCTAEQSGRRTRGT